MRMQQALTSIVIFVVAGTSVSYAQTHSSESVYPVVSRLKELRNSLKEKLLPYSHRNIDYQTDRRLRESVSNRSALLQSQLRTQSSRAGQRQVRPIGTTSDKSSYTLPAQYQTPLPIRPEEIESRQIPRHRASSNPLRQEQPGRSTARYDSRQQRVNFVEQGSQFRDPQDPATNQYGAGFQPPFVGEPVPPDRYEPPFNQNYSQRPHNFAHQVTATERALRLAEELGDVKQANTNLHQDNQRLRQELAQHKKLLAAIQQAIDDSIEQLKSTFDLNQKLKDEVARLESEKVNLKAEYSKMLDAISKQLDDVLAQEVNKGQ